MALLAKVLIQLFEQRQFDLPAIWVEGNAVFIDVNGAVVVKLLARFRVSAFVREKLLVSIVRIKAEHDFIVITQPSFFYKYDGAVSELRQRLKGHGALELVNCFSARWIKLEIV
ncbi:hypothetical protein D3C77_119570 [compost metagenome]